MHVRLRIVFQVARDRNARIDKQAQQRNGMLHHVRSKNMRNGFEK